MNTMDCILPGRLYLGDVQASQQLDRLRDAGVTHIINLAAVDGAKSLFPEHFKYLTIHARDFDLEPLYRCFDECLKFMDGALDPSSPADLACGPADESLQSGELPEKDTIALSSPTSLNSTTSRSIVLVHCMAGVSRSASVVLAYLIAREGMSLQQAYSHVTRCRPVVHPNDGFRRQLHAFARFHCSAPRDLAGFGTCRNASEAVHSFISRDSTLSAEERFACDLRNFAFDHLAIADYCLHADERWILTAIEPVVEDSHALIVRKILSFFLQRHPFTSRVATSTTHLLFTLLEGKVLSQSQLIDGLSLFLTEECYEDLRLDLPHLHIHCELLFKTMLYQTIVSESQLQELLLAPKSDVSKLHLQPVAQLVFATK